jgi:DNA modification methylase
MVDDLGNGKKVKLICSPAEDVNVESVRNQCDFAFTSPPYFCTEIYSEEDTQSCNRYKTGENWRDGFLAPTMRLQYAALKQGSIACMNVADVKIKGVVYPLVDWTLACGLAAGFKHVRTNHYKLHRHLGVGGTDNKNVARAEEVIIFCKE